MRLFKKKQHSETPIVITTDADIEAVIKALAELEPKKVDRVVSLAKSLREYNQKLRALRKGVEDTPDISDDQPFEGGSEFIETDLES